VALTAQPDPAKSNRPKRLFVSLNPGAEIIEQLSGIQSRFRASLTEMLGGPPEVAWVRAAEFHLTLAFLGGVLPTKISGLASALRSLEGTGGLHLRLRGIGCFPAVRAPRVLWVGIESNPGLSMLISQVSAACGSALGGGGGEGSYPHITLGRLKPRSTLRNVMEPVRDSLALWSCDWYVREFALMESCPVPGGHRYQTLEVFPLSRS
jgi:2'-5' RNA ligase